MQFQVGDSVVHWTYGPGIIVQIDKKVITGSKTECYVVKIGEMTLWVPLSRADSGSLRPPTPAAKFTELLKILRSPGQPLSSDRLERRTYLIGQLKGGTLEAICQLVRDLSTLKRTGKMNDHDKIILERSQKFLLTEWEIVLSVPANQAEQTLRQLLEENAPKPSISTPPDRKGSGRSA
jgi:RNA polymerase-interacting CarD/CdnL/TRCF family regulator